MAGVKEPVAAVPSSDGDPAVEVSRIVEGRLFDCPEGFVVTADCLGQTYSTVIGEQPLTITLPSLRCDKVIAASPLSSLVAPEFHYNYPPPAADVEPVRWGEVTYAHKGKPQSALIESLYYTFTITGSDRDLSEVCRRIDGNLTDWWERVAMWLDTYTDLNLLRHGPRDVLVLGRRYGAVARHDDGTVRPVNWTSTAHVSLPELISVPCSATLARCFYLAGAGAVLPPEWQYLRSARSWLKAGQPRRAVIDGCTAAEIALAKQLHQLLATTDESVREELLLRCNGVAGVAKLVRKFGGSTASRHKVEEKLASVRNRAAHVGEEPQLDQANQALEVATEIVERVRPLATLHKGI